VSRLVKFFEELPDFCSLRQGNRGSTRRKSREKQRGEYLQCTMYDLQCTMGTLRGLGWETELLKS